MRQISVMSFIIGFITACVFFGMIFIFEVRNHEAAAPKGNFPQNFAFRGIGTSECVSVNDMDINMQIFRYNCGYPIFPTKIERIGTNKWQVEFEKFE